MKRSGDCSKDVELGSNLHIITVEQPAMEDSVSCTSFLPASRGEASLPQPPLGGSPFHLLSPHGYSVALCADNTSP